MGNLDFQQAFKRILSLAANLRQNTSSLDWPGFGVRMMSKDGFGTLVFEDDHLREYYEILESFAPEQALPSEMSRSAVARWMDDCLFELCSADSEDGEATALAASKLQKLLKSRPSEWTVFRSVSGVSVPKEGEQFGKILFSPSDHPAVVRVQSKFVSGQELNSEPFTICRQICKAVDLTAAGEIADREFDATLEVINFFTVFYILRDRLPQLGRRTPSMAANEVVVMQTPDGKVSSRRDFPRYREAFEFGHKHQDNDIQTALKIASKLLAEPLSNKVASRVVTAMHWAGKATHCFTKEEAFAYYAIAWEGLLLGSDTKDQLRYRLALITAYFLGLNADGRNRVFGQSLRLYDLRSGIVHTGQKFVTESQLGQLRSIVHSCVIRILVTKEFAQLTLEEELNEKLRGLVLSGQPLSEPPAN